MELPDTERVSKHCPSRFSFCFCVCDELERWAPAGLRAGPVCGRGAGGPLSGIPLQEP